METSGGGKFARVEQNGFMWIVLVHGSDWAVCRVGDPEIARRIADAINFAAKKMAQEAYERGRAEMREECAMECEVIRNSRDWGVYTECASAIRSLPISRNQESPRAGGGGGK